MQLTCEADVTELRQHPKVLLQSTWQLRKILKSFRPEVVHVHGRSTALRCLLAGRSADWFTLHSTHLTHQVAFYDTGLLRKYLSPWGKNFFILDQLRSICKENSASPNRLYKSAMALIASASAHRGSTNA
jgi:UDP-N-acetylglucosamine:LPS N-acetylglucosamine transferase